MNFYQILILFYIFVAIMAFLLRHTIDYATSGGKYKDVNEHMKDTDINKN